MVRDNQKHRKTSLYQKIFLVLFGLLLSIVILEIGLRIGGFTILSIQEHRNLRSIKQKGACRIMCLGESTTQNQYPPCLEKILNQRNIGIKFSVIDKGLGEISSIAIVSQLETNLDKYNPDIVVTMMGINDEGSHVPYEAVSTSKMLPYLRSLKVYKLTRLLWLHLVTKLKETGLCMTMDNNQTAERLHQDIPKDKFKEILELNPKNNSAYITLGKLYKIQGKFTESEQVLKKAIELNPENAYACGELATIYGEIGNNELSEMYAKKTNNIRNKYYNPITINNYRTLRQILDKRKVRLLCVQYPVRSIEPLKKIFREKAADMIFVDNEKIFKDAIRKESYKEYFIDMFGGDFGHCTEKGNGLLAENIANTILKKVFNK